MLTVATLLRGRPELTLGFLESFATNKMVFGGEIELIAACNNDHDAKRLESVATKIVRTEPFSGGDEQRRIEFVAYLWMKVLEGIESEFVLLWDDDVVPPSGGIKSLNAAMTAAAKDVAGVVAVYPFRTSPNTAVLFQGQGYFPIPINDVPNSILEVAGGGTGFSIWRTKDLKMTFPWEVHAIFGGAPYGTDRDIAIKLKAAGKKILCDGRTRCKHLQ